MKVTVSEYNEKWDQMFNEEAERIKGIFADALVEIHHIGSTSVPGLRAKPIIDIMPVVRNIEAVDHFNEQMAVLGYECMGEFGISGRRYFRKGRNSRTHHVHVFQMDNKQDIDRHLAVRDYLRSHPEVAEQYGKLKYELAKQYPKNKEAYIDGKEDFVVELEGTALQWYLNLLL